MQIESRCAKAWFCLRRDFSPYACLPCVRGGGRRVSGGRKGCQIRLCCAKARLSLRRNYSKDCSSSFRPTRREMPACRSISTKRRTSPNGAKLGASPRSSVIPSDARRNACLQERFNDAAHEPQRGEVSEQRRASATRNPLARNGSQQTERSLAARAPLRDDV